MNKTCPACGLSVTVSLTGDPDVVTWKVDEPILQRVVEVAFFQLHTPSCDQHMVPRELRLDVGMAAIAIDLQNGSLDTRDISITIHDDRPIDPLPTVSQE